MKNLPICVGLARASEQELVNAFSAMADRHSSNFEIYEGCKLFAQWSRAHLKVAAQFAERFGKTINSDPARVRSALFHGMRVGGYGLLRDLQDLLLLTHQTRTAWTALDQAAKELKEIELASTCERCAEETDRQIDWLCTHIKIVAPQALTVPPQLGDEIKSSLPKHPSFAGLPEITWAPLAAGVTLLAVGLISVLAGQPWLLPSLGPTAYLIAEMPEHPSSRVYNIVLGHLIGLAAGFIGVALFSAWHEPSVLTGHILTASRLGAAAVAIIVTLFMGNMLKASHPPAAATTLLVALGSLATMADAINVFIGAVLMAAIGKLIRTLRTKAATPLSQQFQPEITSRMAAKLDASAPR
jgi:hypothetical protein